MPTAGPSLPRRHRSGLAGGPARRTAPAEFWFSAPSFHCSPAVFAGAVRHRRTMFSPIATLTCPVLIIDAPVESPDPSYWLESCPSSQTSRLPPTRTSSQLRMRARSARHGAPALPTNARSPPRQLDTRVGRPTQSRRRHPHGRPGRHRWRRPRGVALQGPDDPRARLDEHLEQAFLRLRTPWLLGSESRRRAGRAERAN